MGPETLGQLGLGVIGRLYAGHLPGAEPFRFLAGLSQAES